MKKIKCDNPKAVAEEAFWLAWKACRTELGMGILQRNPGATKADVLRNIANNGDYPSPSRNKPGELYGDYVFGRMMKLLIKYNDEHVLVPDHKPNAGYQAWSVIYETYEELIKEAINEISTDIPAGS